MRSKSRRYVWYWHIHHNALVEQATMPISHRKRFIEDHKRYSEIDIRLKLLRRVKNQKFLHDALDERLHGREGSYAYEAAVRAVAHSRDVKALHRRECKSCPWNGKTIFPKEK